MRGDTELRNLKGKRSLQVLATSDKNPVCEFYFTDVNNDLEYKDPKLFPIRTQRQFSFTIQYVIVLSVVFGTANVPLMHYQLMPSDACSITN